VFGDAQADVERLPQILLAVPKARLEAMQRALRTFATVMQWLSHKAAVQGPPAISTNKLS
jgi:hypothetical protein